MPNVIDSSTMMLLLPETLLVLLAVCVYVGGAFSNVRAGWAGLAFITLLLAGLTLHQQGERFWFPGDPLADNDVEVIVGGFVFDALGQSFRWVSLMLGLLFVLSYLPMQRSALFTKGLGSIVFMIVGMMVVASACDLVTLFLGLELVSIPTYILLFIGKKDAASAEASAKYFFLSILSSALLLYGFSMLYGLAGTTNIILMKASLSTHWSSLGQGVLPLMPLTIVLILAGLGFKVTAVPFHFFAPDVYQGTTNANAGLLSVAPKIVGVVALIRVSTLAIPTDSHLAWQSVVILAMITMTVGNCSALWQMNIRRLLAYSSIANAGYMLIGLAAALAAAQHAENASAVRDGVAAMIAHVVLYSVAAFGTFSALAYLDDSETDFCDIRQLVGFGKRHPLVAAVMTVCLFSLSGIPPLAGFWGKFLLFRSAIRVATFPATGNWFWILVVVAALNAAIAAAYYLRIISMMYFQEPKMATHPRYLPAGSFGPGVSAILCAVLVVLCVAPGILVNGAYRSAETAITHRVVDGTPSDTDSSTKPRLAVNEKPH